VCGELLILGKSVIRHTQVLTDGRRGANQILRRDKSARFTKDSPILPGWLAGPSELPMPAASWR